MGPVPLVSVADLAECRRGQGHPLGAVPLVAVDDLPQLGRLCLAHASTIVRRAGVLRRIPEVPAQGESILDELGSTGCVVGMPGVTTALHGSTGFVVVLTLECGLITTTTPVERSEAVETAPRATTEPVETVRSVTRQALGRSAP